MVKLNGDRMANIKRLYGEGGAKPLLIKENTNISEAYEAVRKAGLIVKQFIEDGEIHRVPTTQKPNSRNGWYTVYQSKLGVKSIFFGNWQTNVSDAWSSWSGDRRDYEFDRDNWASVNLKRKKQIREAGLAASEMWNRLSENEGKVTPYLKKKNYSNATGARADGDNLVIPIYNRTGELTGLQSIMPTGEKRFNKGSQVKHGFMLIGSTHDTLELESKVCITEGYATGLAVYEATGFPVAVVFSANFCEATVKDLREMTKADFLICLDNDENEVGQKATEKTCANIEGCFNRLPPEVGDWDDMMRKYSPEYLRRHILKQAFGFLSHKVRHFTGKPPEREWLVDNYIESGKAGVMAGVGGIGKSMEALRLALMVAKGQGRWFGHNIKRSGNVIYISAEDDRLEMHRRIDALDPNEDRHEFEHDVYIHTVPDTGKPVTFMEDTGAGLIITEAAYELERELELCDDLNLVIIDPVQAFTTAPISSSNEAGQMWAQFCTGLASRLNVAVISVHHMSKVALTGNQTANEARAAIRGASSLVDGHRFAIAMWNASDVEVSDACLSVGLPPDPTRVAKVSMVKANAADIDRTVRLLVRRSGGAYFELVDDPDGVDPGTW